MHLRARVSVCVSKREQDKDISFTHFSGNIDPAPTTGIVSTLYKWFSNGSSSEESSSWLHVAVIPLSDI